MKKHDHLPIFGVGPVYVVSIVLPTLGAVLLRDHPVLTSGRLTSLRPLLMCIGALFITLSVFIWIQAVIVSKLDENIKKNHLVTSGVYAWVRHPVYSAFMLLCTGMLLIAGNAWFFILPFLYWGLLTVLMQHTEEKWLKDRYGNAYKEYCRRVNRCWPWIWRCRMSLTYKIAAGIVRLLGVKKIFRKSKKDILEYAKKQNAKSAFDMDKAMERARRKKYFLFDRNVMGHRVLTYQKNETPAKGAVLYLFGGGMITGPDQLDFSLSERIMEKTGKDVWFLFYPLCTADQNIKKTYDVCLETYKKMTKTYEADKIGVLGFSSGACLALGIFLHNNALGRPLPMPGRILAVSPGGLPNKNSAISKELWEKIEALNAKDILLDPAYFHTAREILEGNENMPEYMLDGTCGDFSNFPKTYFYYGENECLYAFAEYFEKAMDKYHSPHERIVGEGMCHCYPLLRFFREGREAQDKMIALLQF